MDPYNNSQTNYFQGLPYSNNASAPYANKALEEVKNYYDPYTSYASDPEGLLARIMGNFNQSPQQQRANQERLMAQSNTAASQGRALNPMQMRDQGDLASSLYNQDMQQYIQNVLAQQQLGLGAAQGAAGDVGNIYNQQGAYAYQGERQKESDKRALINSIIQALGTAAGASFGGPMGAAAGGAAGSALSKLLSPGSNQSEQGYGFNNPNYSNLNSSYNNSNQWMNY